MAQSAASGPRGKIPVKSVSDALCLSEHQVRLGQGRRESFDLLCQFTAEFPDEISIGEDENLFSEYYQGEERKKHQNACDLSVIEEFILNNPVAFRLDTYSRQILSPVLHNNKTECVLKSLVYMQQNLAESFYMFLASENLKEWKVLFFYFLY
jgi:hypothetical protein